ncbi:MAG: GatB/YqeY domain-containing protein [Vicinamibacterales bacterium]
MEQVSSLNQRIAADLTTAMKAKDTARLSALRMLKAAIMNKGMVEKGRDLNDAEVLQVVASLVKQRRDSIEQFAKAGRTDLVEKETGEIAILEHYLPPAVSAGEIDAAVAEAIAETGASSAKDMGKVMKAVMPKLSGKNVDGRTVNDAVRRKLGG